MLKNEGNSVWIRLNYKIASRLYAKSRPSTNLALYRVFLSNKIVTFVILFQNDHEFL